MEETIECIWCHRYFKPRGIGRHRRYCFRRPPVRNPESQDIPGNASAASMEEGEGRLLRRLAHLKRSFKIINRVPKAARVAVAEALITTIDETVQQNSEAAWTRLLLFPFMCLRVPDPQVKRTSSLATEIKKAVSSFLQGTGIPEPPEPRYVTPNRSGIRSDEQLSRSVQKKIAEGDIKGAVRLMCSEETFASGNEETLRALHLLHPTQTEQTVSENITTEREVGPLQVNGAGVKGVLLTFPAGSAGGPDALKPQHLKDLISKMTGNTGERLLGSLASLCNLMLAGSVPPEICPSLYGASLLALNKKGGGIRPIAVGFVYRRLAAKLGCSFIVDRVGEDLRPHQLGFGTPGGAEAAAHAARLFTTAPHNSTKVFLKLDFKNAFNCLNRTRLLNLVQRKVPELSPFLNQCYGSPSKLAFGEHLITSATGVQQGDPLGPALFCTSVQHIVNSLSSELNLWYLDDASLGGDPETVLEDALKVRDSAREWGLEINGRKCELMVLGNERAADPELLVPFEGAFPGIKVMRVEDWVLLGSPLSEAAISGVLDTKTQALQVMSERLNKVPSHCAFFLLKNSLALPKLAYVLRCAPVWKCEPALLAFDDCLKHSVESVTNTVLDPSAWVQATLPVKEGGTGLRRATDLALPSFLASTHFTRTLVDHLLPENLAHLQDQDLLKGMALWEESGDALPSGRENLRSQKAWDSSRVRRLREQLHAEAVSVQDKARLKSTSSAESGAWLEAVPSSAVGTLLEDSAFRTAFALRVGAPTCRPHVCPCGASVDELGVHGLRCVRSAGRLARHSMVNDVIRRALASAAVPATLEPAGLSRDDGKRPDGMTLIPWANGKSLVWDFTCVDSLAPSNAVDAGTREGGAAEAAESRKVLKYLGLSNRYLFKPVGVETMGAFGPAAKELIRCLGKRISHITGEPRSRAFLKQRISLAIQRGNFISVSGTLTLGSSLTDTLAIL